MLCAKQGSYYLRLPADVKLDFIDNENKIDKLMKLSGCKYVGVDSEWRPQIHKWHKTEGVAIFQIGSDKDVFLIDLVKLKDSAKLNSTLSDVFTHENTTVVGFSFKADLAMFTKSCPSMIFVKDIPRFLDL